MEVEDIFASTPEDVDMEEPSTSTAEPAQDDGDGDEQMRLTNDTVLSM